MDDKCSNKFQLSFTESVNHIIDKIHPSGSFIKENELLYCQELEELNFNFFGIAKQDKLQIVTNGGRISQSSIFYANKDL